MTISFSFSNGGRASVAVCNESFCTLGYYISHHGSVVSICSSPRPGCFRAYFYDGYDSHIIGKLLKY